MREVAWGKKAPSKDASRVETRTKDVMDVWMTSWVLVWCKTKGQAKRPRHVARSEKQARQRKRKREVASKRLFLAFPPLVQAPPLGYAFARRRVGTDRIDASRQHGSGRR